MKRPVVILAVAALGLTACTDQPVEPEPRPTVTETVTADPTAGLPIEDEIVEAIATVLEHPDPTQLPQGTAALEEFSAILLAATPDEDAADPDDESASDQCLPVFDAQPEVAGHGVAAQEDDEAPADEEPEATALTALGFVTPEDAMDMTDQVQDFVDSCTHYDDELDTLTHHTDEAVEIRFPLTDDEDTSVVLVRSTNWVYAVASTPATDVGLALTSIDQLDEMLR